MALDFDVFAIALLLAPFLIALIAPLIAQETGPAAGWILAIVIIIFSIVQFRLARLRGWSE